MIITLKGATFTKYLDLNSWMIVSDLVGVTSSNTVTKVTKGAAYTTTFTINTGYTLTQDNVSVVCNGVTKTLTWDKLTEGGKATLSFTPDATVYISIKATGASSGGGEEPETPINYTFTINPTPSTATVTLTASGYTQSGNSITVPSGTSVSWSVSASGYTTQSGTQTVTSTSSKSVTLIQPGVVSVLVETGASKSSGYFGTIPINGFAPTLPISAMPDEITGVRFHINGETAGDEKEMTAFIGYYDDTTDTKPTVIKSVTKMVTLPAKNVWKSAADFPIAITKEEVLEAVGENSTAVLALGCYHSDLSEETGQNYTVGFGHCESTGLSGTEAAEYKGGYFYKGKWALNSGKEHIYAAFLTGDVETTIHTITYKYMSGDSEVLPSTTETVYHNEVKKFTDPQIPTWNFVSVNMEQAIVSSDITVIYQLERPAGNFVIAETGAKQKTGYQQQNLGINGFAVPLDKTLLPSDTIIKGIRLYLAGPTEDEVINMTAFLGYSTVAPYDSGTGVKNTLVQVKTVEQDVTMTGYKDFTQATDFMFESGISVADFLNEVGDYIVYIGWHPTDLTVHGTPAYDIGSANCKADSVNETAMAGDKGLYHFKTGFLVNSSKQHIYAGLLTNYQD